MEASKLKVLFVSSSGKVFKLIPFIKSQYESLLPLVEKMDHYRIHGSGIKAYISAYKDLKKKLRNEDFDIIHAHWVYAGIICSCLAKKEKLIVSFMGSDLQGFYTKKYNILTLKGMVNILLSQYLLFKANGVIVKSKKMLRWIPRWFRHKTHVIPNGVNLNRFGFIDQKEARLSLQLAPNRRYIAFMGNTTDANKNFSMLRKAAVLLSKEDVDFEILAPFPVDASQVPLYLAAANVLAFPSKLEGSPNIIKEAIAMRCPIVATDVGDVRERIANIQGCYISKLDEHDFSNKLKAALSFNNRINSFNYLEEISENNIAKKLVMLYNKIIRPVT